MYRWRKLTDTQRQELLAVRRSEGRPWHSPAHYTSETELYMITATCFEHRPIIGKSTARMRDFEEELLRNVREHARDIFAWNILPNHYHLLLRATDVKALLKRLGKVHGRTSYFWKGKPPAPP